MPKAAANIVKFPTRRIVRRRGLSDYLEYMGTSPERMELEAALASIDRATAALTRQRASVSLSLRHARRQDAEDRFIREGGAA